MITFLKVSTNNKADTVLESFQRGVQDYGLLSRLHTDREGENILFAEYMLQRRGTGRGSIIMGRSVHNQRIERLWRDLFSGCISYFYCLFYRMEDEGVLNPESVRDLFCLQFVFLPKIQRQLDLFRSGWYHHRV